MDWPRPEDLAPGWWVDESGFPRSPIERELQASRSAVVQNPEVLTREQIIAQADADWLAQQETTSGSS